MVQVWAKHYKQYLVYLDSKEKQNDDTKQFDLPVVKTQISDPTVIVIPVAIYV